MGAVFTLLTGLLLVGPAAGVSAAAGNVDGTVAGSVFQDFGSTGIYTTGDAAAGVPRNRPIAGVTATAYDADGDAVGTATSAADGTYTITVTDARSQDLRVEFSGWDAEVYQPGFAAQTALPAGALGSNDTSVQFVDARHRRRRPRRPRPDHPGPGHPGQRADLHRDRVRRRSG